MAPSELEVDTRFLTEWNHRPVVLTGATGFVGFHLAHLLRQLGADVTAIVRPSSNTSRLQQLGVRCKIGTLEDPADLARCMTGQWFGFHIAGAVDFENDWARFHDVNVRGTANFLKASRRAGLARVVVTSSVVAVGASETPHVLNENATWNLGSLRIPYATTKKQAEDLALDANTSGCEVVVVNPSSVIGPKDYSRSEFGTLCSRFWRGRIPFHFGGGNNFVDVRDVAWGHVLAMSRGRGGQRYLLTGTNLTSRQFFATLENVAHRSIPRFCLPNCFAPMVAWLCRRTPDGKKKRSFLTPHQAKLVPYYFYFESAKARTELGWSPRAFQPSLEETYHFWMQPKAVREALPMASVNAA